jgi:hypothetical protein
MGIDRFAALGEALPELAGWRGETAGHAEWGGHGAAFVGESEAEAEQFFGRLAGLAAGSPALRRLGLQAARAALGGLGPGGLWLEAEEEVSPLARVYPDQAGRGGIDPISRIYPDAMMEHLGHAAAEAESLAEAEGFLGALIPLATTLLPRVAPVLRRAAPALIRGVSGVARTLLRSPTVRPLVRPVPAIVKGTALDLARRVGHGRPVTPQEAVRALARQTTRVLGTPNHAVRAWRRSRALDRHFHRHAGLPTLTGPASPGTALNGGPLPAPSWGPQAANVGCSCHCHCCRPRVSRCLGRA